MGKLSAWLCVLCVSFVVFASADASAITKREAITSRLSELVTNIQTMLGNIPLVGSYLKDAVQYVVRIVDMIEVATNGAIGRFLGGALPCKITLDNGTSCSGLQNNGGIGKVLLDVINGVPSLLLPGFVKSIIAFLIHLLVDPTADVVFGGITEN